jgi:hypothetical protein
MRFPLKHPGSRSMDQENTNALTLAQKDARIMCPFRLDVVYDDYGSKNNS